MKKIILDDENIEDINREEDFSGTDSLSAYFRDMSESTLMSATEQAEVIKKYNSFVEEIWSELCLFAFVANEYIHIIDETSADNISERFMILSVLAGRKKRAEALILDFADWRSQIVKACEKCYQKSAQHFVINNDRKKLQALLQRYRPQNSYIYEWCEVAESYFSELRGKDGESSAIAKQILNRIQLGKKDFFSSVDKIEKLKTQSEALRKMILERNLRLVISTAKHFQNRGASLNDLIQEGNIGLIKALDKFDCRLGNKFSTYAVWWIKYLISKALAEQTRTIRIPAHMMATINKMKSQEQLFIQEQGREPTADELATILDMPKERVRALQRMAEQPISLQAPLGEDSESSLEDFLEDENSESPVGQTAFSVLKEKINTVLDMLSERERLVISMRFGLNDYDQKTLEEISGQFGISKERVRQIELKALEKLRHPMRRKHLEGYF